jgi:hypothetical protein
MSFKEYISDSTLSRMSASVSNKEVPTPQGVIINEGKRGRNTKEYSNLNLRCFQIEHSDNQDTKTTERKAVCNFRR